MGSVLMDISFQIPRFAAVSFLIIVLHSTLNLRADDRPQSSSSIRDVVSTDPVSGDKPTTIQIREVVQRSIPYIEEKGVWWIERKKCVTCHRVGTMLWSLQTAKRNGFVVSDKLDEWSNWAITASLAKNDKGKIVGLGNKVGVVQILKSLGPSKTEMSQINTRKKLVALLHDGQQPEGSWKPGGQLPSQKRSKSETTSVTTMWLALTLLVEGNNDEDNQVLEQAMKYINKSSHGRSIEWYALKLLLAAQKKDDDSRDQFVKQLRSLQRSDGGWGWIVDEKSDALGTGIALYALLRTGLDKQDTSIKRAQRFLVNTQRDDGSWPVRGTKEKKKDRVQETAVFWGTTWAVIGLVESLPLQSK